MSSTRLFTALAAFFAASTVSGAAYIKARQEPNYLVYVTTDADFKGDQLFQEFTVGQCFNFDDSFQDSISSIATVDTAECTASASRRDLNCPVGAPTIYVTNQTTIPDLGDGEYPGWDNSIKSATCTV